MPEKHNILHFSCRRRRLRNGGAITGMLIRHCATWRRFIRVMMVCCTLVCGLCGKANITDGTCDERIDVTDYLRQALSGVNFTSFDGLNNVTNLRDVTLDFSSCTTDDIQEHAYHTYGDTIMTRQGGDEVEAFFMTDADVQLSSITSRLYNIQLKYGLPYYVPLPTDAVSVSHSDTLTITQVSGANRSYPVVTSYAVKPGGKIIPVEGDTISSTDVHISQFCFTLCDNSGVSSVASFTNVRWIAPERSCPIVEWVKYSGWNGDREYATMSVGGATPARKEMRKKDIQPEETIAESYSLIITDLSGIVYRSYSPTEVTKLTDYDIPAGWYIFTRYYPDKTVSEKKYIKD